MERYIFICMYKRVAIHNKNGQGLLLNDERSSTEEVEEVAIHNKNGQGLLLEEKEVLRINNKIVSQSTIKMDKGYYLQKVLA